MVAGRVNDQRVTRIRYSGSVGEELSRAVAASLLRLARLDAGLSQSELARRAGVPRSEVCEIEAGRRQPSIPVLSRILRGAGLELRLQLEPIDDQNEVLASRFAKLTAEEQEHRRTRHARNVEAFSSAIRQ